ncbi:MAG TPA: DUF177 domain-containing protein [bacterium]
MIIHVSQIPEDGCVVREALEPSRLDIDRDDVHLREAIEVEARVNRLEHELIVRAGIRCPMHCVCARCLEEFIACQETNAIFNYRVEPTDTVDITDDVRQEIILGYPMVPVCRPDCRGLCLQCGQNLNLAACQHVQEG